MLIFIILVAGENSKEIISSFKLGAKTENIISRENLIALASITGTLFAYFSIVILYYTMLLLMLTIFKLLLCY